MPKRSTRFLVVGGLAALVIALAPAAISSADHGSDSTGQSSTVSTSSGTETETPTTPNSTTERHNTSGGSGTNNLTTAKTETENTNEQHNTSGANDNSANEDHRLTGGKLKVCSERATEIAAIMSRSEKRAQNQIDLFTTIATRTETFYTNKGKTLASYDALVAAVTAAKSQAETDLQSLKGQSFSCDSTDPKGQITAFKTALTTERSDLKAYRTAVKNLIVGVKSVTGETQSQSQTQSQGAQQ